MQQLDKKKLDNVVVYLFLLLAISNGTDVSSDNTATSQCLVPSTPYTKTKNFDKTKWWNVSHHVQIKMLLKAVYKKRGK